MITPEQLKFLDIFAPHSQAKRADLLNLSGQLVHYTSAENAVSIIQNEEVWLRNVRCMNDYMEIEHGVQLMNRAISKQESGELKTALDDVLDATENLFPGIKQSVISMFNSWFSTIRNGTYVTSLSIHDKKKEDEFGRLSMWRAYNNSQSGVALIIDPKPFYSIDSGLGAYSSPVFYFREEDVAASLREIEQRISSNESFLKNYEFDFIKRLLFDLIYGFAVCCKHPGFSEEKEWRILHTDFLHSENKLVDQLVTIHGIPQKIKKIKLGPLEKSGMNGITIPEILKSVIIGPTQYPEVVYATIHETLHNAGIENPSEIIKESKIPLRM